MPRTSFIASILLIFSILISCETTAKMGLGVASDVVDMAVPDYNPMTQDPKLDRDFPPMLQEINFRVEGDRLNGIIYVANGLGPHPTVLLLHGYPGNEKNLDLAQDLRRAGFNVMFFHYRGAWGSEGDFSFANGVADVGGALRFLRDSKTAQDYRIDTEKLILIGHSFGGFTALMGASEDSEVRCVAGLAAADFGAINRALEAQPEYRERLMAYVDSLSMLSGQSGKTAIEELDRYATHFDIRARARTLEGKRVLLVAASEDEAVSVENVHKPMVTAFRAKAGIDLEHVILDGDHSFSWSRKALSKVILDWVNECR